VDFALKLRPWLPLHENAVSRAAHFLGGFLFVFAISVPLGWLRFDLGGLALDAATVAVVLIALHSIFLEPTAGLVHAVLLVPGWLAARAVSTLPPLEGGLIALGVMAFRFAIVVGGHVVFEKKTHGLSLGGPLLFVSEPVYLVTLALWKLGMRRGLEQRARG
jgi:uncharacterized membrane protein YGL010W